jgi:hypothetical protein
LDEFRKHRLTETGEILTALQFGPKQRNETVAYTPLALLDLRPDVPWAKAQTPLRGITPDSGNPPGRASACRKINQIRRRLELKAWNKHDHDQKMS